MSSLPQTTQEVDFFQALQGADDPMHNHFLSVFDANSSIFGFGENMSVSAIFDELSQLTTPTANNVFPFAPQFPEIHTQPTAQPTPDPPQHHQHTNNAGLNVCNGATTNLQQQIPSLPFTFIAKQPQEAISKVPLFQFGATAVKPLSTTATASQQLSPSPVAQSHSPCYSPLERSSDLLTLVEGFSLPPTQKINSGRDNRQPLPRQVIELNLKQQQQPPALESLGRPLPLKVCLSLIKIDKVHNKRVQLGDKVAEVPVTPERDVNTRFVAKFDNVVIKETSHNNGGKLYLRFTLLDANNAFIAYLDSAEFQTITNRGRKKADDKKNKVQHGNEPTVDCVSPAIGPSCGGQLVKIMGQGFMATPANSRVLVKFGEKCAREVYSVKRNVIVCETPEGEGQVDVTVSFDGGLTVLESSATYKYINPNNTEDVNSFISQVIRPNNSSVYTSGSNGPSPITGGYNNAPMSFAGTNNTNDNIGQYMNNVLHHLATRNQMDAGVIDFLNKLLLGSGSQENVCKLLSLFTAGALREGFAQLMMRRAFEPSLISSCFTSCALWQQQQNSNFEWATTKPYSQPNPNCMLV